MAAESPSDGRQQTVAGGDGLGAGVHQQEAAGAIGILGAAHIKTGLSERGRLLVTGDPGNRYAAPEDFLRRRFVYLAGRHDLRQHAPRYLQDVQQFVIPIQLVNVVEQRPAGIAVVGHMPPATGQSPHQERVHGSKQHFATLRPRADPYACRAGR